MLSPAERLDHILVDQVLRAFPPFGASRRSICFSESPPAHLAHLIADRGFPPWGIVVTRESILQHGGGAVAYLPEGIRNQFPEELRHWVVPIKTNGEAGDWSHEREWRLPLPADLDGVTILAPLRAILVGDLGWRPTPIGTDEWIDMESGTPEPGPVTPFCEEITQPPWLWQTAEIWHWNPSTRQIDKYAAGTLA
jgi:hypothetical protein